jgi:hypothetical protein
MSARDDPTDGSGHPAGGGRPWAVAEAAAGGRRRRAPLAGGRRPPNSETGHVDSPGRCPRAQIGLKLGVHTGMVLCSIPYPKVESCGPSLNSWGAVNMANTIQGRRSPSISFYV